MSKILVIGNGFDLAHGLPTKYTDFLNFSELFLADDNGYRSKIKKMSTEERNEKANFINQVQICRNRWGTPDNEYIIKFKNNRLIEYFFIPKNRREKWVDFESLLKDYINDINIFFDDDSKKVNLLPYLKKLINKNNIKSENKKRVFDYLRNELDELIDCLNFYFNQIVYKTKIIKYPKELYLNFDFDYILSFNYTDTYNRVCKSLGKKNIDEENIHYIHGKSKYYYNINNMVLGITDSDPTNLDTLYFKKYFQRIQKHTGIKYEAWIESANKVVFIGHSMDVTDEDIIKKLILNIHETTIYYRNQSDYEQKVINLIKIFGKEQFEKLYYEQRILFKELSPSVNLPSSKIVLDKMRL